MKDEYIPAVGDIVRLNDTGLKTCFGTTLGLDHMKTKEYRITRRSAKSLTFPELTFDVSVDDPGLSSYMLCHWCFDFVRKST